MTTLIRDTRNEPYRLASYLHRTKGEAISGFLRKLHRKWCRNFPDPVEYWPEMLACVAFVSVLATIFFLGLVVAGVIQ